MKKFKEQIEIIFDKTKEISCPEFGSIKNAGRRLCIGRINLAVNQQINNTL